MPLARILVCDLKSLLLLFVVVLVVPVVLIFAVVVGIPFFFINHLFLLTVSDEYGCLLFAAL